MEEFLAFDSKFHSSPLKGNRRLGGTVMKAGGKLNSALALVYCASYSSTLVDGGEMFLRNVGYFQRPT
jgi:hypothetical protein